MGPKTGHSTIIEIGTFKEAVKICGQKQRLMILKSLMRPNNRKHQQVMFRTYQKHSVCQRKINF